MILFLSLEVEHGTKETLTTSPGGILTKIDHKAQPPLEVFTPFCCSHQMIFASLFTCEIFANIYKYIYI